MNVEPFLVRLEMQITYRVRITTGFFFFLFLLDSPQNTYKIVPNLVVQIHLYAMKMGIIKANDPICLFLCTYLVCPSVRLYVIKNNEARTKIAQ